MSWEVVNDFVAYSKQHFEEGLIRAGFQESDETWHGTVKHSAGETEITISLPRTFPFAPPRVRPTDADSVPWSWHRELSGALCLVAEGDHEDLWWKEASAFLEHVEAWLEGSNGGWAFDRPDLDLERYFHPAEDNRLYIYGDLRDRAHDVVRFMPSGNNTMKMRTHGILPRKASAASRMRVARTVCLGHMNTPPRNWQDLSSLIDASDKVEEQIRAGKLDLLLLTYKRGDHEGTILVEVWPSKGGPIQIKRLLSAADTADARIARSGPHSGQLAGSSVALIGVGALGSFVSDMLVRAGVGRLTLIDNDLIMPGNLVRHLVGPEAIGLAKVQAVRNHLIKVHGQHTCRIAAQNDDALSPAIAAAAIQDHDLVIDATASFRVTALFHTAARALESHVLSAVLQNNGETYRLDVLPPLGGAPLQPRSSRPHVAESGEDYFEAGCGSPISPTAPQAVIEAAAATVRHAVALLAGQPLNPSGEVRHFDRR